MVTSAPAVKRTRTSKAWSCFTQKDGSFHVIAFAPSGPKARCLCAESDQEFPKIEDWIARRFREADGLSSPGSIWLDPTDAPEQHRGLASTFWHNTTQENP